MAYIIKADDGFGERYVVSETQCSTKRERARTFTDESAAQHYADLFAKTHEVNAWPEHAE